MSALRDNVLAVLLWLGGGIIGAVVTLAAVLARLVLAPVQRRRHDHRRAAEREAHESLRRLLRAAATVDDRALRTAAGTTLELLARPVTLAVAADDCRRAAQLARRDHDLSVAYLVIARRIERMATADAARTP